MKLFNFPSSQDFCIRDCVISNTDCKLIFPHKLDIKWNEENKIFRSSIWTKDGELVSASWKKFTNFGEQPEFEPLDIDSDIEFVHKLDGSTLIVSKFKGKLITRTRGTYDATVLNNGDEIYYLKQKYPLVFNNNILETEQYSIVCEWYSPKNVIVEREAKEPTLWLTGIIKHEDYSYLKQKELDEFSYNWKIERPIRYNFNSLSSMVKTVNQWKRGEGIVIYSNNGQILKKVKSERYLWIHRVKSQLNSENNLIEYYIEKEMPSHEEFFKSIETEFDFEIATQLSSLMEKIVEAGEKTKKHIKKIEEFVHEIRNFPSRREIAQAIKNNHKESSALAFSILDEKMITPKQYFDLIKQNV